MTKITSMSREDQAKRRKDVYAYFKEISVGKSDFKIKKETIYKRIADKFGYANTTSVMAVIRQLKLEEEENNKINLIFGKGVVESLIVSECLMNSDVNGLDFRYKLENSDIKDTVFIRGSYNSGHNSTGLPKRLDFFDHFSVSNVKAAVGRISNLLQECNSNFLTNSKK